MKFKGKLSGDIHHHPDIWDYITKNKNDVGKRKVSISVLTFFYLRTSVGFLGYLILFLLIAFFFTNIKDTMKDVFSFGNAEVIKGVVKNVVETNMSVNERSVMAIEYEYDIQGVRYEGFSFKTKGVPGRNQKVEIEIVPKSPETSRLKGGSYSMIGKGVFIPLGIFCVIIIFFIRGLFKKKKYLHLLKEGLFGEAKLIKKEETNMTVNYQRVFKLTYAIQINGESQNYVVKTHEIENLTDEAEELALYNTDGGQLKQCTLIDQIPGEIKINEDGIWYVEASIVGYITTFVFAGLLSAFLSVFVIGFIK